MSHLSCHLRHSSFEPWAQGGSGGQSGHVWWHSESLMGAGAHINEAASLQTEAWWSRQRNVVPGSQFVTESSIIPIFSSLDLNERHVSYGSCYISLFWLKRDEWIQEGQRGPLRHQLLEQEGTVYHMMDGHLLSKFLKGQDEGGDVRDWRLTLSSVFLFHRRHYKYKQWSN